MNEIQLNELISRAQKLIGGEMPVAVGNSQQTKTVNYKFVGIGSAQGFGEDGGSKNYQIDGILQASDGDEIRKPLKVLVNYFENKKP
jgi:hypothetical protein